MTRKEATFYMHFPNLTGCETFAPQQQTGAEHNDILRETVITPAQWNTAAAGEGFVYTKPQVSQNAGNGIER